MRRLPSPRRRSRLALAPALAACASLAAAVGAAPAAAGEWVLPASEVAPPSADLVTPVTGLDGDGDALAAWTVDDGSRLMVARRPAGGGWSAPQPLAEAPEGSHLAMPALDVAPDGDAVLVWTEDLPATTQVATFDAADGRWSEPHDFPLDGSPASQAQAAIADDGTAVVAWLDVAEDVSQTSVHAARLGAGGWSAAARLSGETFTASFDLPPQVLVDGGPPTVLWSGFDNGDLRSHVQAVELDGGAWSAPHDLTDRDEPIGGAQAAVTPAGDAVAAWLIGDPTRLVGALRRDGVWTTEPLSEDVGGWIGCQPNGALAVDGAGFTVAWSSSGGTLLSRTSSGATWAPQQQIFAPAGSEQAVGVTLAGGHAAWIVNDGDAGIATVLAAQRGDDGWGPPRTLASGAVGAFADPRLASGGSGDLLALWRSFDANGAAAIAAAGFQATAPRLSAVAIPATATTGQPAAFSAAAGSTFADAPTLSWTFGDGSPAAGGGAVSHAFAAAGSYPVTVTATDAFGATARSTATIVVSDPARIPDRDPDGGGNGGRDPGGNGGRDPGGNGGRDPGDGGNGGRDPGDGGNGGRDPGDGSTGRGPTDGSSGDPADGGSATGRLVAPRALDARRALRLTTRATALSARLQNGNRVALRGSARLVQLSGPGVARRARTIATVRSLSLAPAARRTVRLPLSRAVLRQLRARAGRAFSIRLDLTLRAADGRRVTARLRLSAIADRPRTAAPTRRSAMPKRPLARASC